MRAALALLLAGFAAPAAAQDVALTSAVFVERETRDTRGNVKTVLEAPGTVTPGDRLVFLLRYRNGSAKPVADFIVTNPLPRAVAFQGTPDANAAVSVDGGRAWGALPVLKVREPDGSVRGARPEDVTHVRWTLAQVIAPNQTGHLKFRGVVR